MNGNFLLVLVNANKHMQVGNSPFVAYNLMDYQCGERKVISHVDEEQDLRIWCAADLKPSFQCQHVASKAMRTLALIKGTFKYSIPNHSPSYAKLCPSPFRIIYTGIVTISGW